MYTAQLIGTTSRSVCAGFGTPGMALTLAGGHDALNASDMD